MAEYNQDRFELEIQAKETQSPERTTTAKVFVSSCIFFPFSAFSSCDLRVASCEKYLLEVYINFLVQRDSLNPDSIAQSLNVSILFSRFSIQIGLDL